MSLQKRLVAVVAVLLVIGLVVADVVTYASVRSFLYGQADNTLAQNESLGFNYVTFAAEKGVPVNQADLSRRVSSDVYVVLRNRSGRVILMRPSGPAAHPDPAPILTKDIPVQQVPDIDQPGARRALRRHLPPRPRRRGAGQQGRPRRRVPHRRRHGPPGDAVHLDLAEPDQRHAGLAAQGRDDRQPGRPPGHGCAGSGRRPPGAPTAAPDGRHGRRHRLGRPDPTGARGAPGHRGGPPGLGPEPDAVPDRGGLRREVGLRGAPAPVRGRRLPRAADPPDLHPRLRRAAGAGRLLRRGRAAQGAQSHRGGGDPHGRPGRGPPPARRAGPGAPAPGRGRRPAPHLCRRGRRLQRRAARPPPHAAGGATGRRHRRRRAPGPGGAQPRAQRAGPHAAGHARSRCPQA